MLDLMVLKEREVEKHRKSRIARFNPHYAPRIPYVRDRRTIPAWMAGRRYSPTAERMLKTQPADYYSN